MNAQTLAVLSGIAFGIWPLLANRSGMQGNPQSLCVLAIGLVLNAPFALKQGISFQGANLNFLVRAGLLMGAGMIFFNDMLAIVSKERVAQMFLIVLVVQAAAAAVWAFVSDGSIGLKKVLGIAMAIAAAFLLG